VLEVTQASLYTFSLLVEITVQVSLSLIPHNLLVSVFPPTFPPCMHPVFNRGARTLIWLVTMADRL